MQAGRLHHKKTRPSWNASVNRPRPSRKWLFFAVKLAIVAVLVWFIRGTIADAMAQLRERPLRLAPAWLVASGILYLLGLLPEGLFWHRVLRAVGVEAGFGETMRAYFIGHLGKYVPGKAMVVVLRTGLIRSGRVDTGLVVASVFLETLTMMSVGAFLAAAILAVSFPEHLKFVALAIAMMVLAGLATLPPVFSRLARLAGVDRSNGAAAARLAGLRYPLLAGGWAAMAVGWLLLGASLWAVLRAMGEPATLLGQLHLDTAAVAVAVVGGFVSMIPGGLGVREAVLAALLGRQLGDPAMALIAAAALRLVWLVAEVAISGILYSV
jgi:uncharacterized membrane protein YbhN (UPF0104 family)